MTPHVNNPLRKVRDDFDMHDYRIFKKYMHLPIPYLKIIFKRFRSFKEVVPKLPLLFEQYHQYLRSKIMETNPPMRIKKYMVANIPPTLFEKKIVVAKNKTDQEDFNFLSQNVSTFVNSGKVLYFHSEFSDSAINAAAELVRTAVDQNISSYCINFGWLLEAFKTGDYDSSITEMVKTRNSDLVMIHGIGTDIGNEYSTSRLFGFLESRKLENKATIIVSFLSPAEFQVRYKRPIQAITVEFVDPKVTQTLATLKKELERKK